jgi:hypothetical protein
MKTTCKLNLLFGLILFSALVSCRKKVDLEKEVASKPAHCYNSIMDEDEVVVDMGGSCGTDGAQPLTSNCGQSENTVTINGVDKVVTTCTKATNGSGQYVFTINYVGGSLTVTTAPNVYYNWDLGMVTWTPDEDECNVYIGSPYNANVTYGDTQVKFNGVNYAISICEGSFWYGFSSSASIEVYALVN